MNYPKSLKKGDTIGICAPSAGVSKPEKQLKLDEAIRRLKERGFNIIETPNVRNNIDGRSADKKIRAQEFMSLYENPEVSAIIFATAGDFLMEMLDFIDFEKLKVLEPKWMAGYSDITGLSFLVTTISEVPTLYTQTIKDFAMIPLHESLENALKIMMGENPIQNSFDKCEKVVELKDFTDEINSDNEKVEENSEEKFLNNINPNEGYNLEENVLWKNLYNEEKIEISGRAIGGCLDVLKNIIGTKYDNVKQYIEKYKQDGIIWFFDIFEITTPEIVRTLWQFKNAGYFEHCKGILIGRVLFLREDYNIDLPKALKQGLEELDIPVIYDMDIGHVSPQMAMVNGSKIEVFSENGKGYIKTYFS